MATTTEIGHVGVDMPIPGYPDHFISLDGSIYDSDNEVPVDWILPDPDHDRDAMVNIRDAMYSLNDLMAWAYIGKLDLPAVRRYGAMIGDARSVDYEFHSMDIVDDRLYLDNIEFREISSVKDCTGYYISRNGVIYDMSDQHFLHRVLNTDLGNYWVTLRNDYGKNIMRRVDELTLRAWVGEIDTPCNLYHIDGDDTNCDYTNIGVDTVEDAARRPFFCDESTLEEIWKLTTQPPGIGVREACRRVGLPENRVPNIVRALYLMRQGRSHRHIVQKYPLVIGPTHAHNTGNFKVPPEAVEEIRKRYASGTVRKADLAREYGLRYGNVEYMVKDIKPTGYVPQKRFSPAECETIAKRRIAGETLRTIANDYGTTETSISRIYYKYIAAHKDEI